VLPSAEEERERSLPETSKEKSEKVERNGYSKKDSVLPGLKQVRAISIRTWKKYSLPSQTLLEKKIGGGIDIRPLLVGKEKERTGKVVEEGKLYGYGTWLNAQESQSIPNKGGLERIQKKPEKGECF